MKKGGYKIIDFKGTVLSGTAVEMPGIYDQIVDDYDKPIMVSGVILSGELQDDAYAAVKVNDGSVNLTVYGGIITVTDDDEVTFALSKTTEELQSDISDLQDNIEAFGDMTHAVIHNNSDFAALNAKLVNDQVIPCSIDGDYMNTVFGSNIWGYGLGIRYGSATFIIFMKYGNNIVTGSLNLNTNEWSNLTRTQLTTYTPA